MSIMDEMRSLAKRGLEEAVELEATADQLREQAKALRAMARSVGLGTAPKSERNKPKAHKLPGPVSRAKIARAMLDADDTFTADLIRDACGWKAKAQVNDMLREWGRQDIIAHIDWEGRRKVYRVIAPERLQNEISQ